MKLFRIGDIFSEIRNGASIKQVSNKGGKPITRIETIVNNKIDLTRVGYADILNDDYKNYYLTNGDILMSHINSVSHLGKVAIVENLEIDVIHGMNLLILKSDTSKVYSKYLYYYFLTEKFKRQLIPITKKSINQASFNISDLREIEIPLPEYENQIRIANLLEKIETVIADRKSTILLLDELVKATFYKMFGDPVRNEKGWEKAEIQSFGNVITGNTPKRNILEYYNPPHVEWIKTDNIDSSKAFLTPSIEFLSRTGEKVGRIANEGALLVNCIAGSLKSIGRVALTDRKVAFNQQINAIIFNSRADSLFMYWLFKISENYIQSFASGAMKFILSKTEFQRIELILPPVSLQNEFVSVAKKIQIIKAEQEAQLKVFEELYAAVSQKVFNGELDLSKIPYDEALLPKEINLDEIPAKEEALPEYSRNIVEFSQENVRQDEVMQDEVRKATKSVSKNKLQWERISFKEVANYIKHQFEGHYFNAEMLLRYLTEEVGIFVDYFTTAAQKKHAQYENADDFYSFIATAVTGENTYLQLEQVFYNAEEENIKAISFTDNDLASLTKKPTKERSGIYFRIKDEITTR